MFQAKQQKGFSLIELMVAVAIIGVITAIALPIYTDYVATAREGAMRENMNSIRLFQEEARLANGAYQAGTYDPDDPNAAGGLTAVIGWAPRTTTDEITYVVDEVTANSFRVTATHSDGYSVQETYNRP
ncbi:MAG: type IV pilin protein [Pseudomonadales bacterium]